MNLNFNYNQYRKSYIQIYKIFKNNDKIKQSFNEIITRFLNIIRNFINNIIINNMTLMTTAFIFQIIFTMKQFQTLIVESSLN